jgi:histidinol dehydrogenase
VFVGEYSPQAAGDYATGPNHVLPTGGVARFRGGLTVFDFVKLVTVQRVSRQGLRGLAPTITALAEMEGLKGHAQSIRTRFQNA